MNKIFIIIGLLLFGGCCVQTPRENSLLIAEYDKNYEGPGNFTHLVSYNFIDGKLSSKNTILSAPAWNEDNFTSVHYSFGRNFVYKNRYVISANGNVIDTHTKSLVMEESDDFIETKGDRIIFHRDDEKTGTGYLICDLKNKSYDFVKDKDFFIVKGRRSPNKLWGLEANLYEEYNPLQFISNKLPTFYKNITLYNSKNQREIIVTNCGYGTLLSTYSSNRSKVSICWIDNHNFLYAFYNPSGDFFNSLSDCFRYNRSVRWRDDALSTVTVYKVNIDTGKSEQIVKIKSVPAAISNSSFKIDPEKRILFFCKKGKFVIDINKKVATQKKIKLLGDGFSINKNQNGDEIIAYKSKSIGQNTSNFTFAKPKTTSGFLGIVYGDNESNLGVRVWNNITKQWTEIEIPWVSSIIGWIEKN